MPAATVPDAVGCWIPPRSAPRSKCPSPGPRRRRALANWYQRINQRLPDASGGGAHVFIRRTGLVG
jgi:hypothetical protein